MLNCTTNWVHHVILTVQHGLKWNMILRTVSTRVINSSHWFYHNEAWILSIRCQMNQCNQLWGVNGAVCHIRLCLQVRGTFETSFFSVSSSYFHYRQVYAKFLVTSSYGYFWRHFIGKSSDLFAGPELTRRIMRATGLNECIKILIPVYKLGGSGFATSLGCFNVWR